MLKILINCLKEHLLEKHSSKSVRLCVEGSCLCIKYILCARYYFFWKNAKIPEKFGQGEGGVWKSKILADILIRWPLGQVLLVVEFTPELQFANFNSPNFKDLDWIAKSSFTAKYSSLQKIASQNLEVHTVLYKWNWHKKFIKQIIVLRHFSSSTVQALILPTP